MSVWIDSEFLHVLMQSFVQASVSAAGSIFFGFFAALGVLSVSSSRYRRGIEFLLLLPNLLPTLFIIIASFQFFTFFMSFPIGLWGVALIHMVVNMGLVGVTLAHVIESKMGRILELSAVDGAKHLQVACAVVTYLKKEILYLVFFVFTLSFSSFSVPLIVGGTRGETLEVYIYRLIVVEGQIDQAVFVSTFQILFIFLFVYFLKSVHQVKNKTTYYFGQLPKILYLYAITSVTIFILLSSLRGLPIAIEQIVQNTELQNRLYASFLGTVMQCLLVAVTVFLFLSGALFFSTSMALHKFLAGYTVPSTVLVGLIFYFIYDASNYSNVMTLFIISLAFSLTILTVLYRLKGGETIRSFDKQTQVAKVLGASRWVLYRDVLLPQTIRPFTFLCGVAAFWSCGDFALSSMIAGRDLTLAMTAHTLMGGYRVELAALITWLALMVGGVFYFTLERLGHVYSK